MKKIVLVIACLIWSILSKAQVAPVCFNSLLSSTTLSVGSSPQSIVKGDFNSDGKLDLIVANYASNNFSLLLGTSSGTYNPAINFNGFVSHPEGVITKDFNNDSKLDLAFAGMYGLYTCFGTGTGSFVAGSGYSGGSGGASLISGDFNNDGNFDIASTNLNTNNISVCLGSNSGTFSPAVSYSVGIEPYSIIANDFNNDTFIDLATANFGSNNISILFGNGNGTFNFPVNYNAGVKPRSIIASDFSGDGNLDIAVANFGSDSISVFLGNSLGAFNFNANYESVGQPISISAADYNADGNIDIASTGYDGFVSVLMGLGTGNFGLFTKYSSGNLCTSLLSSDLNNDNKIDIAVTNNNGNTVSILLGNGLGAFASTVNYSSGVVNSNILINDFNKDGYNDVAALNTLNKVSILFGSSTGTLSTPVSYSLIASPLDIDSADFNNDGNIDLVITYNTSGFSDKFSVLLGSSSGTFSPPINAGGPYNPVYGKITTSDFNNDGYKDLAIVDIYHNNISLCLGANNGTFSLVANVAISTAPNSISSGDLNNDGKIDIVTTKTSTNIVTVNLCTSISSGIPSYATPVNYSVSVNPSDLLIKDFNLDGLLDIVTINGTSNNISILMGIGMGQFSSAINIAIGGYPQSIASKDLNNDGFLDLVIGASVQNSNLIVLLGTGTGSFTSSGNFGSGLGTPNGVSLGDMNNDGKSDIVSSVNGSIGINLNGNASILLACPSAICVGNNAIITASGAISYTWSTGVNTNSIIVTPNITTTYSVSGPSQIVSCNNIAIKTISVSTSSSPTITVNSGTICSGNSFTINPSGAISYTYSSGTNIVSPNTSLNYSVTGTDLYGCISTTPVISSVTVNAFPLPNVIAAATSSLICIGQTSTLTVSGATSYTWNTGSNVATIAITPTTNLTYSVNGTDANGCIGSALTSITVNSLPTLTITSTNSVCINSSDTINALGASTYTWNTGSTTASINITPTITTTYTVTGTDFNTCSNSQTVTITVDNTCADVWPGDANSDGIADNLDVLELGLHYTQTGAPRATTSNLWQSYYSANWSGTITNGKNLNHSNCNGDGIINDDDTLAIFNNYSLTHAFKPEQSTTNPVLTIVSDQSAVAKGTWGSASINLGNISTPLSNINGIAFTVNYDNTLLETDSVWLEYPTSFINASNQNLKFRKRNFTNGKLFTATTHTINGNVNGYGKIATLHYKIKSTLATDNALNLSISQANQSNASGAISPLTSGSATLMAIGASVGINELTDGNYLTISPNPANESLTLAFSKGEGIELNSMVTIEISNAFGQVVFSSTLKNNKEVFNIAHLSNGVYFVKVMSINKQIGFKKIVVQR